MLSNHPDKLNARDDLSEEKKKELGQKATEYIKAYSYIRKYREAKG